jgi:RNA polymerase sigma-70 factor (ECF subfamily)
MNRNMAKRKDFDAYVLPQLEHLYRAASYVSDNEIDAHDLVQKSLAKGYDAWLECQVGPCVRVWLFRIMANILNDQYRLTPDLTAPQEIPERIDVYSAPIRMMIDLPGDQSDQRQFSAISSDDIRIAIANLVNDYRLIVVLSLLEGFSYQEIAEIAGINLETVRSGLCQGRKLVQRELCDHVACEGNYSMTADRVRSRRTG